MMGLKICYKHLIPESCLEKGSIQMSATKGWRGNLRVAATEASLDSAGNEGCIDSVNYNLDGGLAAKSVPIQQDLQSVLPIVQE